MGIESFNWKSLFINTEEKEGEAAQATPIPTSISAPIKENKFPNQAPTTSYQTMPSSPPPLPTGTPQYNGTSNPFIEEILEVYEKGFESLNQPGFDFFELFKSVNAVGVTNPQSYQMAFTMGKTIQSDLTKEFLIEKAKYYISEIEKVYTKYDTLGNAKKTDLSTNVTKEKANLVANIADLESRIAQLQTELNTKKIELDRIDGDNNPAFSEIQLKIEANNFAKHKILESINTVVTGINQYL